MAWVVYASLIQFNPHRYLKSAVKEISSLEMDFAVYAKYSSSKNCKFVALKIGYVKNIVQKCGLVTNTNQYRYGIWSTVIF